MFALGLSVLGNGQERNDHERLSKLVKVEKYETFLTLRNGQEGGMRGSKALRGAEAM
jgi:hypothetical protein